MLERIILARTDKSGIVLDPFAGTFTAAAVAKRLGRISISIELQEEYLKIGLRRILGWQEYKEVKLLPPQKSYSRKSENKQESNFVQESLFDVDSKA